MMPLVTILMPVYNAERFLDECLDSLTNQTFKDFQLHVCDDASTDTSLSILQQHAERDSRIRILRNPHNCGIAKTRNRLMHSVGAETHYVAIMDADDVCLPQRLQLQVEFLQSHPRIAAVGGALEIIDEHGQAQGARFYPTDPKALKKTILKYNPFAQSTMMLRREVLDACGEYRADLPPCDDYDYWFRGLQRFDFANLPCPLIRYRLSPAQSKQSKLKLTLKLTLKIQRCYLFEPAFRSLSAWLHHLLLYPLMLLPKGVIFTVFKLMTYKKLPPNQPPRSQPTTA